MINFYNCREGFYKWEDQSVPKAAPKGTNGGLAICIGACDDHRRTEETDVSKYHHQLVPSLKLDFP